MPRCTPGYKKRQVKPKADLQRSQYLASSFIRRSTTPSMTERCPVRYRIPRPPSSPTCKHASRSPSGYTRPFRWNSLESYPRKACCCVANSYQEVRAWESRHISYTGKRKRTARTPSRFDPRDGSTQTGQRRREVMVARLDAGWNGSTLPLAVLPLRVS